MKAASPRWQSVVFLALAVFSNGCDRSSNAPKAKDIAYEGFDYPAGKKLIGQTGGVGLMKGWEIGGFNVMGADDFVIGEGSLAYPGIISSGNRLVCQSSRAMWGVVREFGPSFKSDKGTRYISFLIRPEGAPASLVQNGIYYGLILHYGPDFEIFFGKPGGGVMTQYVAETRGGGFQQSTGVEVKIGEVAHLVIRVDFSNGEISDYKFYVNPGATEPAKGVVIGMHDARIPSLMIYAQGQFSLDEVRVVDHYEDLAPKPADSPFKLF